MVEVKLQHTLKSLTAQLDKAQRTVAPKALRKALVKTAKKAFTSVKRDVAKQMGIPQKRIAGKGNRALKLNLSSPSSPFFFANITGTGKPLPLAYFKSTRQLKSGVKSGAYGATRTYPHTFITRLATGHVGVFKRSRSARTQLVSFFPGSQQATKNRRGIPARTALPISEVFGPSVPRTLADKALTQRVTQLVNTELPVQFNRAVEHELAKLKGTR